ncbi:exported hypothetical protein [uncultured Desulfobacterium sp.]|uniref:Uncharacterized protein n=1 Tax=uncultured Desulfobacterium sp. TaxID=201089 RepID=A0A445MUE2_9BACT|nr:exported hypothetical protein [uncultured Desulfobacterium sp.]
MRCLIPIFLATLFINSTNCLAENNLTHEEIELIEIMEEKGILPHDIDNNQIDSNYLQFIKLMLKNEYGIDDIRKVGNPDPRFSSPEKTWQVYKHALIRGDFALAEKCHMPKSRHIEIYKKLGKEKTKEIALAMRNIERISGDDKMAKYRIRRNIEGNEITFYIYFTNLFGEWRIKQL